MFRRIRKTLYNIRAIAKSDFRRVGTSVVGFIIIMGLALLPCLYSWFNIISNWDPYGPESTGNIKIAVVSEDDGYDILGLDLNVGETVVEGLKSNNSIGWQFPESSDVALEGVYSGKYYAALIVPHDFSETLMGFIHGDMNKPHIVYYSNEKKNIIAPKITNKAKTTVQETVNSTFLKTLTEKLTNMGSVVSNSGMTADGALDTLQGTLDNIESNLRSSVAILDSLVSVTDSASYIIDSAENLMPSMSSLLDTTDQALSNTQDRLVTGKEDIIYMDDALKNSSAELKRSMDVLENTVGDTFYDFNTINKALGVDTSLIINNDQTGATSLQGGLTQTEYDALNALYRDVRLEIKRSINAYDKLIQTSQIGTNLVTAITDLQGTVANLRTLTGMASGNVDNATQTLAAYSTSVSSMRASLSSTRNDLADLLETVEQLNDDIDEFRNSQNYKTIMDSLEMDSAALVEYIANPVNLETVQLFAIKDYGAGASPFYTILALWVGGLFNVVIIKTEIKPDYDIPIINKWEGFWGRYIIVYLIGQITALVTGLGNLYFLGVQCYHPLLYLLALSIADFAITFINYALVFAFDVAGLAVSVILMCLQVGGSGGTYPVEVLPKIFQDMYNFMPFKYAMNALRETIGGMYDHIYLKSVGTLFIYPVVFLPFAFLLKLLSTPIMNLVKHGMEKAEIMGE